MNIYLKLFLKGFLTRAFWKERMETLRMMISQPAEYFSRMDKKEGITSAYLLGISGTFVTWAGLALIYVVTVGLFTLGIGLLFLPVLLAVEFVAWVAGLYLIYYVGGWAFAAALKWLTGKNEIEKIRPILFAAGVSSVVNMVPGLGSLLSLGLFLFLLVAAYEKALKLDRGPAVGSAVLGFVILTAVTALPFWLAGHLLLGLWTGTMALGLLGLAAPMFHSAPAYQERPLPRPTPTALYGAALTPTPGAGTPVPSQAVPTPIPTLPPAVHAAEKAKKPARKARHAVLPEDSTESEPIEYNPSNRSSGESTVETADGPPSGSRGPSSQTRPEKGSPEGDAVRKAVGDAAEDAAKKLLGF